MAELKQRRLPTFGTAAERRDRLRKFHGIQTGSTSNYHSNNNNNVNSHANNQASDTANTNSGPSTNTGAFNKKSSCLDQIEKLKINREERRKRMDDIKKMRS